jgi:ATP/ADP translocase
LSLSSTTTVRNATRFVSPLLYAAGCASVLVAGVSVATSAAVVRLSEALPGSSYLFENVVLLVVLLLLLCALLFAVLDLTLYRLERSQSLGLKDHARHCALLYAGVAFVLVVLFAILNLEAGMLQYDLELALCAVAAYGILVDAGVVLSMRRLTRAQPGGAP